MKGGSSKPPPPPPHRAEHRLKTAESAAPHLPDDLRVVRVGRHLVIHQEHALLCRGPLAGIANRERTGHIRGHGLGHVDVQSGLDGVARLFGEEVRDVFERNGLDAALDHPLVAGKAGEAARLVDAQGVALLIGYLLEVVGDGVELVAAVLLEQPGNPPSPGRRGQRRRASPFGSGQAAPVSGPVRHRRRRGVVGPPPR